MFREMSSYLPMIAILVKSTLYYRTLNFIINASNSIHPTFRALIISGVKLLS